MYQHSIKRFVDILLAGVAIVALSPLLLATAAAVRLEDGGRAIFRQRRIGRNGGEFWLMKFRSMPENTRDMPSDAARNVRITRVGKVIRRTNIDELPQLINILRGDMSIVGPRPALPAQTELIALRRQNGALACVPGLTGLAQVNSYDAMSVQAKAEFDGRYAARVTFTRDVTIIIRTVKYLFSPPPTY